MLLSIKDTKYKNTALLPSVESYCYTESHHTECRYTVCHYAESHCAECHYAKRHSTAAELLPHHPKVGGSSLATPDTGGLYYNTFYGRNLRIFLISLSVCPLQAFPF